MGPCPAPPDAIQRFRQPAESICATGLLSFVHSKPSTVGTSDCTRLTRSGRERLQADRGGAALWRRSPWPSGSPLFCQGPSQSQTGVDIVGEMGLNQTTVTHARRCGWPRWWWRRRAEPAAGCLHRVHAGPLPGHSHPTLPPPLSTLHRGGQSSRPIASTSTAQREAEQRRAAGSQARRQRQRCSVQPRWTPSLCCLSAMMLGNHTVNQIWSSSSCNRRRSRGSGLTRQQDVDTGPRKAGR